MNITDLPATLAQRITVGAGDCWLWSGATTARGYSNVSRDGRNAYGHRVVFHLLADPSFPVNLDDPQGGLELDHVCEVRNCVNPDHLEPVTHAENQRRKALRHPRPRVLADDDPRHGQCSSYSYWRCRCAPCRSAATAYHRALKSRRTAA